MSPTRRSALIGSRRALHRTALRAALEQQRFEPCIEATDSQAVVAAARVHAPEVALLDADLPGDGIVAAGRILAIAPATAVVILGDRDATPQLLDSIRVGACGYLPYDSQPAALAIAAAAVAEGEAALPRTLVRRLIDELQREAAARDHTMSGVAALTAREREVLALLTDGLSTAEISAQLFVSKVTVRTHVSAILRKLGVSDRPSAVLLAQGVEIERSTPAPVSP